jgi:polyhydroxyalkanoate synthesis regulator phasin
MPQPKKPGPSTRKAATSRPAARKPARKAASPEPTGRSRPPDAVTVGAAPKQAAAAASESESADDALHAAVAMLRGLLSRGVVISSDRLQETVDEAVRRGRMTRDDAEELVANVVRIGRRQTQDALAELEGLVERSTSQTRRLARLRVRSVAAAARHAPGTDRALRVVDRVRRAAGLGSPFPISGYDELTAAQVKGRLAELSPAELRKVRDHERRNANRKSILAAIEKQLR